MSDAKKVLYGLVALLILFVLTAIAIVSTDYHSRQEVANLERQQCVTTSRLRVTAINNLREDVLNLRNDIATIESATLPPLVKLRSITIKQASISSKLIEIQAVDRQINVPAIPLLRDPVDRSIAYSASFRCIEKFPSASVF